MSQLTGLLASLAAGEVRVVDLTNTLSSETPTIRLPEPFASLVDFSLEEVSAYNQPGPFWKHHNISTGEHIGTHLDAPIHWVTGRNGKDVSQIEPSRLVGPACVLDVTREAAADADFLVDVEHIKAWEDEHGPIPENAWLLVRTGWGAYAQDHVRFLNADEAGAHTPGFTVECARWLADVAPISGVGVETVGIDAGLAPTMDPIFPLHHFLLGADKYGITSLQNLELLPATGAVVVVAPLPIVGGTGSPARVLAFVDGAQG
ncbi:cyclase family protein [Arthrobacter sp. M4]|uniref:cyclase family protein n=1 Tax=Arthrobacter sp. M4 TaxID=218160 RepID=UPI001CDBB331|nr:cyclase family protein [Arthrobacter sp. M4]MCA4132506.1 cyclase family protein [Arthrobacter sp. M4]